LARNCEHGRFQAEFPEISSETNSDKEVVGGWAEMDVEASESKPEATNGSALGIV
jgi:hypothetical protein